MRHLFRHITKKNIAVFFLVLALALPPALVVLPQEVNAVSSGSVVEAIVIADTSAAGLGTWANTYAIAAEMATLTTKEYLLDTILWLIVNVILEQMILSVIDWVNSGFEGAPTFVTDFRGFLFDIADRELGTMLEEMGLGILCSPFSFQIQLSIAISSARRYRDRACTLSDMVGNLDRFLTNSFSEGGWAGWFQLTQQNQNNPYGSYLDATSELQLRISGAQQLELFKVNLGNGFLSQEVCLERGDFGECIASQIQTPGTVIQNQLDTALNLPTGRLTIADEIDELIGALLSQLVSQVFSAAGGLLGTSQSQYSRPSYLDQIRSQSAATTVTIAQQTLIATIDQQLPIESQYLAAQSNAYNTVVNTETNLTALIQCYQGKISSGTLTSDQTSFAQSQIQRATNLINTQITPRKTTLAADVANSNALVAQLNLLRTQASAAASPSQLDAVSQQFSTIAFHDQNDLGAANIGLVGLQQEAADLNTDTSRRLSECQAFPPPSNDSGN